MSELEKRELTSQEEIQVRKTCVEADAIYEFMESNKLGTSWKYDTERFMFFAFFQSKELVKHSITLISLTRWLKWLTLILIFLTIGHIWLILVSTPISG